MADPREQKPVIHSKKHMARLERERRQTRFILFGFIGILVIVVGLLIYGFVDINYLQPRRPVAKVGNTSVTVKDWQTRVRMQRSQIISQIQLYAQYQQALGIDLSAQQQQLLSQLENSTSLGQGVIDTMIDEELIRQEAAARGMTVSEEEVEQSIQAAYQYYPLGTPTPTVTPALIASPTLSPKTLAIVTITPTATLFPTPSSVATSSANPLASPSPVPTQGPTTTPAPTSTPLTEPGYLEAYRSSVDEVAALGLAEEQLRELYEGQVLRQQLLEQIAADVPNKQEQVWARHILVPEQAAAEVVRQRILAGEDFAAVAAEVSTDTGNKDSGGDLGWFGRGAMVPEFENAAFGLEIGAISEPIATQFGYHIIQVLAHGDVPLSADAFEQARQAAFSTWLTEARTKYNVVVDDRWRSLVPTDPDVTIAQ